MRKLSQSQVDDFHVLDFIHFIQFIQFFYQMYEELSFASTTLSLKHKGVWPGAWPVCDILQALIDQQLRIRIVFFAWNKQVDLVSHSEELVDDSLSADEHFPLFNDVLFNKLVVFDSQLECIWVVLALMSFVILKHYSQLINVVLFSESMLIHEIHNLL